jgi:hypothetical protein
MKENTIVISSRWKAKKAKSPQTRDRKIGKGKEKEETQIR